MVCEDSSSLRPSCLYSSCLRSQYFSNPKDLFSSHAWESTVRARWAWVCGLADCDGETDETPGSGAWPEWCLFQAPTAVIRATKWRGYSARHPFGGAQGRYIVSSDSVHAVSWLIAFRSDGKDNEEHGSSFCICSPETSAVCGEGLSRVACNPKPAVGLRRRRVAGERRQGCGGLITDRRTEKSNNAAAGGNTNPPQQRQPKSMRVSTTTIPGAD